MEATTTATACCELPCQPNRIVVCILGPRSRREESECSARRLVHHAHAHGLQGTQLAPPVYSLSAAAIRNRLSTTDLRDGIAERCFEAEHYFVSDACIDPTEGLSRWLTSRVRLIMEHESCDMVPDKLMVPAQR